MIVVLEDTENLLENSSVVQRYHAKAVLGCLVEMMEL